jgi:dephospho-CoA kinase
MKYVIGLTGTMGSGKSTVLRMLGQLGARIIDADALAHQAMTQGTATWRAIVDNFGEEVLDPQGNIDRRRLASVVFEEPEALQRLEEIVHPAVDQKFREILETSEESVIAVEAVKLIESGIHQQLGSLWLVTCPHEERVRRLVEARGEDPEEIRERLAAQMSESEQAQWADVTIDNGGSLEHTWEQVRGAWEEIQEQLCRQA